jgi:hypothetical protein
VSKEYGSSFTPELDDVATGWPPDKQGHDINLFEGICKVKRGGFHDFRRLAALVPSPGF